MSNNFITGKPEKLKRLRVPGFHPNMFKGFLIAKGFDPPKTFASVLGYTELTMTHKISGDSPMAWKDLYRIRDYFNMTPEQFCDMFFDTTPEKVRESTLKDYFK